MKKRFLIINVALSLILFSCERRAPNVNNPVDLEIQKALVYEYAMLIIEGMLFNSIFNLDIEDKGQASTHERYNFFNIKELCTQSLFPDQNLLILDFDNGCVDSNGSLRSGTIEINYDDPSLSIGSQMEVSLINFKLNRIAFNGKFTMTNTSQSSSETERSFTISFQQIEYFHGALQVEILGSRNIQYIQEYGPDFGSSNMSYFTSNDVALKSANLQTSVTNQSVNLSRLTCWRDQTFLPQSGKVLINVGNSQKIIDFDTDRCDISFFVIESNGSSELLSLDNIFL